MSYQASIIIPLFNKKLSIEKTIKSILSQTEQNFEIIIVDDGSTDDSINIVKKINDNRIKLYQQTHSGVSSARNFGVFNAQSDYIAFLDADDEWDNIFLETVLNLRIKYPQAGIYLTNFRFKQDNNIITDEKNLSINIEKDILITNYFKYILKGYIKTASSCIAINKKIFNEEKGFKNNVTWGEDQDLWGRIALKYPVAYSPKICVTCDRTGNWLMRGYDRVRKTPEHPFILSGKIALKEDVPKELRNDVKEIIALYQLRSANLNMIIGNFSVAKKILTECNTLRFKTQKMYMILWTGLSTFMVKKIASIMYVSFQLLMSKILNFLSDYIDLGIYF
jgi:glycosyltransferase involved in cell wall biosynthesis